MNGVQYYRRKRGLSREQLAARAGLTVPTILNYEKRGFCYRSPASPLLNLADALGITLDELLSEYDGGDLTTQDRTRRSSKIDSPHNAVSNYRIAKNLRFEELSALLGLSARESARTVCKRKTARPKHIETLARLEGISPEEFLARYLPGEEE